MKLTTEQQRMTLREYLDEVYFKSRQFADGTGRSLKAAVNKFEAFTNKPMGKLTDDDLKEFLRLPGHATSTKAKMKDLLQAMLRHAGIYNTSERAFQASQASHIGLASEAPVPPSTKRPERSRLSDEHAAMLPSDYLAAVYAADRQLADASLHTMERVFRQFEEFNGNKLLGQLTEQDVEDFVRYMWRENCSRSTIGRAEDFLQAILRHAGVLRKPSIEASAEDGLWTICERDYFPKNLKIRSEQTRSQYRFAVRDFSICLGHEATLADLDDDNVVRFLKWSVDQGVTAGTSNSRAERITALWNWLAKRGVVHTFPTSNKLDTAETMPKAWSEQELARLFSACDYMERNVGGIPGHRWWRVWLLWLWNTGARFGESEALTWEMIDLQNGTAIVPAEKRKGRKKTAIYRLWRETIDALKSIRIEGREEVFRPEKSKQWHGEKHWRPFYYAQFGKLLKFAGLPSKRRKTQAMRISHATWLRVRGGDPTKSLMHSDPATTQAHYLDPRFIETNAPDLFVPEAAKVHQKPSPVDMVHDLWQGF